jgi:hypothetical protein
MRNHGISRSLIVASVVSLVLLLAGLSVIASPGQRGGGGGGRGGQAAAKPMPPIPRLSDGTPSLGWVDPAHKGVWRTGQHRDITAEIIERKEEGVPFQPWAKALYDYRIKTEQKDDPEGFCLPTSGPSLTSNRTSSPWEFLQMTEQKRIIRIFQGQAHMWQVIYMDGRPHPQEAFDLPTWMGHSTGQWDGDTLVVDTVGFNEGNWLSVGGAVQTSQLHLIERFTRVDYNNMRYEATIDDPGAYTRPFKIGWNLPWGAGQELFEVVCVENNKYPTLYPVDEGQFIKP